MGRQDARQPDGRNRPRSGANQRGLLGGQWAERAWRDFTHSVRSLTDHVPLTPRGRAHLEQRRAVDRQWQDAARSPRWADPRDDFGMVEERGAPAPAAPTWDYLGAKDSKRKNGTTVAGPRKPRKPIHMAALVALMVVSLLVGCVGTQVMMRGLDMVAAGLDIKSQLSAIQEIAHNGTYTQPAELNEMQTRLQSIESDLIRLQSDLPTGALEGNKSTNGLVHVLNMSALLVRAGEYGVDAGQVLIPAVKGVMSGLGSSAATAATTALTVDDLTRVTFDVDSAGVLVKQAMVERAHVSDSDLNAIGLGKAVSILHKLDSIAPKLPEYLYDVHFAASALPALLGLTGEAQYLLFSQDSDELRPTGGFLGNYALLTFSKGKLTSGVHLTDIYSLDCPGRGYPWGCKPNQIPSRFSWLSDDPGHFAVRDSNLDPDFANSAGYIEQNYSRETGQDVQGVIAFTPAFIGKILDVVGGLKMSAYGVTVTSANLQDTIHYYHLLYAYCQNPNYAGDSRCKETVHGGSSQTSDKKTFDSLLGSTLMKTVSTAGAGLQGKVLKAALDAISSRDLQIYFNNQQVEGLLNLFHADNTIPAVQGDQLMVVDANVGATYSNGDLKEQISDTITLNPDGSAAHDMTITYTYPWEKHLYGSIYAPATAINPWQYSGVLLTMVPEQAQLEGRSNCGWPYWHPAEEPNRQVWGCAPVYVSCTACNQDGSNNGAQPTPTVIELRWVVPGAVTTSGGTHKYAITMVHEAGTHPQVTLTIVASNGQAISSASTENPPLKQANGGAQLATNALTSDQTVTVSYKG